MADAAAASFALFPTAIGACGIAWREDSVVSTNLPEASDEATRQRIARRAGGAIEAEPPARVRDAIAAITSLLAGERTDLAFIACDFGAVGEFRERVYAFTRTIPPGQTLTYGEVASRLGDKQLAQAVGRAMGSNPLPIIVPCHRVMGANGKLTGFSASGGVATKLRMLAIEGAAITKPGGLFDALP